MASVRNSGSASSVWSIWSWRRPTDSIRFGFSHHEMYRLWSFWDGGGGLSPISKPHDYYQSQGECTVRNPPGKEIYRKGNHSIFEVRLISNDLSKIVKYFLRQDSSGGWEGPQAVLPKPVPPGQAVPRPQDPLLRRWAFHFLHSLRGGQVAGVLKLWNNLNLGTPQIWLPHCGVLFQRERKPWWKQCCLYSHLAPIPGSMPSLITLWLLIFSLIYLWGPGLF